MSLRDGPDAADRSTRRALRPPIHERVGASALGRLLEAIVQVVERSGGRWTIVTEVAEQELPPSGYVPIIDVDGQVVAIIEESDRPEPAPEARLALEALLVAYDAIVASELSARRARKSALDAEQAAHRDHLTGLHNRRGWDDAVDREEARTDRSEARAAMAVVDLDGLKRINDEQGHLAGDLLIRRSANVLTSLFRGSDVVARIGGDEFAVLVVDLVDDAASVADRIRRSFEGSGIEASVGVATQAPGERLRDVFHRADLAMYAHKRSA
jgi:diguanylate cyclase (GGDEF)-like protein